MNNEVDVIINYQGNEISLFSDQRADYVSLTDIFKAHDKYYKSISAWLKTKQTLDYLDVWEKKHNPNYDPTQLSQVYKIARERNGLSAQTWIDLTHAKGIFTRSGERAGTYAHKDIAIRFAGWLNPEFELFLAEEIQRLKEIEKQKESFELLNHEQILFLVRLKEVFKFVAHQTIIEDAHKEVFAAQSGSKNAFAEFNTWRNKALDIAPEVINERLKEYCKENNIPFSNKLNKLPKREKILKMDSYESVRIAVWDFLIIQGNVNAENLSKLVKEMIGIEKGEVLRENATDLFHTKQDLGEFTNFALEVSQMKMVKSAREALRQRALHDPRNRNKELNRSNFDQQLKGLLSVQAPKKEQ